METSIKDINQAFSTYVSEPQQLQDSDKESIHQLIEQFPYCQILHAFNCKISKETNSGDFRSLLEKAAIYAPDRKVLYNIINKPQSFSVEILPMSGEELDSQISGHNTTENNDSELIEAEIEYAEIIEETPFESNIQEEPNPEVNDEPSLSASQKNVLDKEEKILLENIASTDFFTFGEKLSSHTQGSTKPPLVEKLNIQNQVDLKQENKVSIHTEGKNEVSKYDDDQLPYSFLWWLQKTRKEHADTYQPYVNFTLDTSRNIQKPQTEELDQQIKENIFHLQSPLNELQANKTVHFELRRKEEAIIERFIREEPQIKPPAPNKLDNENKAKKSAEYPNDLVSETLASIYTEQMLFHKAIDTYKKLSLKFPEKSAYFADQIRELEKKIN